MSGAILQGVPATTLDTDLWINLPSRSYMRMINLARAQGATMVANTVIELVDGALVNFVYEPDGLDTFDKEHRRSPTIRWFGMPVKVLRLDRIAASKRAAGRPKDIAHMPLLETVIAAKRLTAKKSSHA